MRVVMLSVFAIFILSYGGFAQSDWGSVRELKPGTMVVVVERTGVETKGRVISSDETALSLDKGRAITRDTVARIYLTKRGSVVKRALIGAAAGAGIGTVIGIGITLAAKDRGLAAAEGFLLGIPAGAVVGAASAGRKRGRVIYQSP